mgnify:CR=1 FL=1
MFRDIMCRLTEQVVCTGDFNDFTLRHDGNPVTNLFDDIDFMGNENDRQAKPFIQVFQQFENLQRRDRIKSGRRFVT